MVLGHVFMQVYLFSDIHIFFRTEAIMFRLGHTPGHMIRLVNTYRVLSKFWERLGNNDGEYTSSATDYPRGRYIQVIKKT